jgi:hypothetical protein
MKEENVRTVRTAVQTVLAVAVAMPVLLESLGVRTAGGVGAGLVVAASVVTRVHSIPAVNELLNKYLKIPK